MEPSEADGESLFPRSVGERLAEARKAAGLELADIATRTRIPLRQLEALEAGRYSDLPAVTYCIGFAKSYARAIGIDEIEIARDMRAELNLQDGRVSPQHFEAADPARVPPRALAWTGAALVVLIFGGFLLWRSMTMDGLGGRDPMAVAAGSDTPRTDPGTVPGPPRSAGAPGGPLTQPRTGDVVLTATDVVWLRITDANGQRLFEKEMQPGERYQVPPDAADPRIITGRPDALTVTVGGREIAPLGPPQITIRDVGISAEALAARPAAPTPGAPPT